VHLVCRFASIKSVVASKEFKAGVVHYNKLARTLSEFQILWHASWLRSLEAARSSLQSNLIIAHPETGAPSPTPQLIIRYRTWEQPAGHPHHRSPRHRHN